MQNLEVVINFTHLGADEWDEEKTPDMFVLGGKGPEVRKVEEEEKKEELPKPPPAKKRKVEELQSGSGGGEEVVMLDS